jgi:hypothetical protein
VVQFTEVTVAGKTGYFGYTPTAKQPGFVVGFSPTYNFISDAAVVTPEPASFSLCLIAAGALFGGRRLLKARAKNT